MKRSIHMKLLGICAPLAPLSLIGLSAQAQNQRLSPDLLQTLGVGSRSVALGNAFSAIADDPSATFWNPGRLGFLNKVKEVMLSERTVLNTRFTTYGGVDRLGANSGKPQFGFGSFLYPLDKSQNKGSALGFSYTLGGYFSNFRGINDVGKTPGDNTDPLFRLNQTTVRNSYFTVAWGKKVNALLGIGIGLFYLNQDFTTANRAFGVQDSFTTERGQGLGVNLGLAYNVRLPKGTDGVLYAGMSYRPRVSLYGLSDQVGKGFNIEVPGRLSLGIARQRQFARGDKLWMTGEFEVLEAANRKYDGNGNLSLTDARRAVSNIHLGMEYLPKWLNIERKAKVPAMGPDGKPELLPNGKPRMIEGDISGYEEIPLRIGFRTNSNAAFKYTYYDYVLSVGAAYIRKNKDDGLVFSIEPTVELLARRGVFQATLTGRIGF